MSEVKQSGANLLSRRNFLRGVGTVGVGAMLAACAAPGGAPASGGESGGDAPDAAGKEIKFYVFWGSPGAIADQLLADEALESYIGTGNTIDFKSGFNQEARLTAVASGTPPDIGIWGSYLDFMSRGAVIPLDDYIATSDVVKEENFIPGNWDVIQYQGTIYGVPGFECFVRRGLNYNTRLVEEAGLDPDNPPVTWDELMVWHEALTKFDDAGNLVQFGIDPYDAEGGTGPGNDGWYAMESWGVTYFDEDTKEFNLDNDAVAQSFDVMGEFVKIIGPDNLAGLRSVEGQGTWGGAFNAEVQAMIIEGYWHPGETVNEKPEVAPYNRATWVPVPEDRRGTKIQFGGGHMAQIFKEGTYKDEAWPVAEWIQSDHVCNLIFDNIGWLPAYLPYFESADQEKYPGLKFYFDSVQEATYWGPYIRNEIQAFIETQYQQLREQVFRGELTGAQAAAQLQEDAVKEWQQAGFG
ncbi:MAG: extracellular solute-binding protein [Caldilineaceae bacterium]|nr:extracellular solute-binding protein [Caldilineaceae bacterium]